MKFSTTLVLGSAAAATATQTICNKYTKALLKTNTASNQETLLTLLVNTVVIGNYSTINTGVKVPGILAPAYYDGEHVNLLPYFNGALESTNQGGQCGVSVNFLDGGGAAPLLKNKPANSKTSNQYFLLTHLYQFFASLLGCSEFGNSVQPYAGTPSMYQVHKFMALDNAEVGWFIHNVGLAALSFGVSQSDASAVGSALYTLFGHRCEGYQKIPPAPELKLQSICTECDCPLAPEPHCNLYAPVVEPKPKGTPSSWCGSSDWKSSQEYCSAH